MRRMAKQAHSSHTHTIRLLIYFSVQWINGYKFTYTQTQTHADDDDDDGNGGGDGGIGGLNIPLRTTFFWGRIAFPPHSM